MKVLFTLAVFGMLLLNACAPLPPPVAIISNQPDKAQEHYELIGSNPVSKKDCHNRSFIVDWGPNRQGREYALISDVLEENKADALLEAQLTYSYFFIPIIFMQNCVSITGKPVKLKGGSL